MRHQRTLTRGITTKVRKNAYIPALRLAKPMRRTALVTALTIVLVGAGCSGSDEDSAATIVTTGTLPTDTNGTTAATDGIDPLEGASTAPVTGEMDLDETALLERVAVGRNEGYDRVVFQFRNGLPGYRVEYVRPPLREDGSGNRVQVAGNAFVLVRMELASGFDVATGEGELVYKGPRRLSGADAGTSIVKEVVRTGDFEAVLSWAIGLDDRVDFRVLTLENPARIAVDFRNH
jgi:hypothetical protein